MADIRKIDLVDTFACAAMQTLLATATLEDPEDYQELTIKAYTIAQAMMEERDEVIRIDRAMKHPLP